MFKTSLPSLFHYTQSSIENERKYVGEKKASYAQPILRNFPFISRFVLVNLASCSLCPGGKKRRFPRFCSPSTASSSSRERQFRPSVNNLHKCNAGKRRKSVRACLSPQVSRTKATSSPARVEENKFPTHRVSSVTQRFISLSKLVARETGLCWSRGRFLES